MQVVQIGGSRYRLALGINMRPYSKNTSAKRVGIVAQVVENLPSKYKAKFKPQY
jgi:hypothetical protein